MYSPRRKNCRLRPSDGACGMIENDLRHAADRVIFDDWRALVQVAPPAAAGAGLPAAVRAAGVD
ncbi:MAG: hypothetical protein KIS89_08250 [Dokdonella sp.]|nr:hypothetical protein [Dokdonella sp.]